MQPRRFLLPLVAALALAATAPSVAVASTPCWQRVINDWSQHNGITGHYSPACLRQAMKNAPPDLTDYTGLIDDINAALIGSIPGPRRNQGGGGSNGGSSSGSSGGSGGPGSGASAAGRGGAARAGKIVPNGGTPASAPAHSRGIPLPLILLAAVLAAAALAAGSPPLFRRLRGRFPRPRPVPQQTAAKP